MLPIKNRLRKKKDFEKVFREGRTFPGRFFILKIKENNLNLFRFAFVFPVKNEKKAVKRNRGKRMFREIVQSFLSFIKKEVDVIFIIKKGADERSYGEIKEDVEKVFKKIKLI